MPRILLNDISFHYLDEGAGPVMLLLGARWAPRAATSPHSSTRSAPPTA